MTIGAKTYSGPSPFSNKDIPNPVRKITTASTITSATDTNTSRGKSGVKAAQVAIANPADNAMLSWKSGQDRNVRAILY